MTTGIHYHVVGAAGTGMNAIAQLLAGAGAVVSGSDRDLDRGDELLTIRKLREAGIRFVPQDGSGITSGTEAVIVSTAIEDDNPDIVAAQKLGVPVVHRAAMLSRQVTDKQCIVVTGTSGKTTVTGMLGWTLTELGADPTVVNGGALVNWSNDGAVGNVRMGASSLCVVEGDESDRSLLEFSPDWAIVTNIGKDHFGLEETQSLFEAFSRQVESGIVGELGSIPKPAENVRRSFAGTAFEYGGVPFRIAVPGRHNVENARLTIAMCEKLGFSLPAISSALSAFRGIERRLQVAGRSSGGVTVVDDYAHNPAKIRAAWESVASSFEHVVAIWRPHGFGPLAFMREELADVFADLCRTGDRVCVLPVYYAGGTAERRVTSAMFVDDLCARGVAATCASDYDDCIRQIAGSVSDGDAVLSMGARDPHLPELASRLAAEL